MKTRVAINRFGRIGRQTLKAIWQQHRSDLEIAAIGLHDLEDAAAAAHLLRHDSNYGRFPAQIEVSGHHLAIDGERIALVAAERLSDLPWRDLGVDLAVEATGAYDDGRKAEGHLHAGARKAIVTTGSQGADFTMICGVNETDYDPDRHHLIATDTETTNALAVVVQPLAAAFDVRAVLVTSVRAYNNTQKLFDTTDSDLRRARAAPRSIVPTTMRAAATVGRIIPGLAGKVDGYAVRVPVPVVSMVELTIHFGAAATVAQVNDCLAAATGTPLGRVLGVSHEPLVSSDYSGCPYSAVVDLPLTIAIGPLVKVSAWCDNEWGFSSRVADVTTTIAASLARE